MATGHFWESDMAFNENLKRLRRDKGMNQNDLATKCKVNSNLITKLEKEGSNPELGTIYKLMEGLGCSANTLLLGDDTSHVDSVLAASFERASQLPDKEKEILIDLMDKYCFASGMDKMFENRSEHFVTGKIFGVTKVNKARDSIKKTK